MQRKEIDNTGLIKAVDCIAKVKYDGHFTIMAFTGNYRVMLGTPYSREDIDGAAEGQTLEEALLNCIKMFANHTEVAADV